MNKIKDSEKNKTQGGRDSICSGRNMNDVEKKQRLEEVVTEEPDMRYRIDCYAHYTESVGRITDKNVYHHEPIKRNKRSDTKKD